MENSETVLFHFTLEFESLRRATKFDWMKNICGVLHDMENTVFFHRSMEFLSNLPHRGGSNTKWRDHDTRKSHRF